jgi:hypothetical protein
MEILGAGTYVTKCTKLNVGKVSVTQCQHGRKQKTRVYFALVFSMNSSLIQHPTLHKPMYCAEPEFLTFSDPRHRLNRFHLIDSL